jgi:magnesium transporter
MTTPAPPAIDKHVEELVVEIARRGPREASELLKAEPPEDAAEALRLTNPGTIQQILGALDEETRAKLVSSAPARVGRQWERNRAFAPGTVGQLMNAPQFVAGPHETVRTAVERLRDIAKKYLVTYGFVVDDERHLIGVLVMRDLLLADPGSPVEHSMIRSPFFLTPDQPVLEAMRTVVARSYPEYPVCDEAGRLIGIVRGQRLFEQQAFSISAQAGAMVGVDREERLSTPWPRSFRFRHPWLQLNLLTAFVAAAVVGAFQDTIDRFVLLAVFLPVLAGQSGNTGCQALAVTLRGMTLGHLQAGMVRSVVLKESLLGAINGVLVGITAGIGMLVIATLQQEANPVRLALIVVVSMTGACIISGAAGALIPVALERMGADPATASSIFLTTATDVASMGMFLSLAALLL